MLKLLLVAVAVFLLLVAVEYFWRAKKVDSELTRKSIHIGVGIFAAFWPWFLSWNEIYLASAAFFVVVILVRNLSVFDAIYKIERKSIGDVLFAASIGVTALITHERAIFAVAMLHLGLADGAAAVIGSKFGKKNTYKILGADKSMAGTFAFWFCSFVILAVYFSLSHTGNAWPTLLWLPLTATLLENIGVYGTDNLLVPLAVALVLGVL